MLLNNISNADAVLRDPMSNEAYFVKPLEVEESFTEFVRYVQNQERSNHAEKNVKYSQAR